MAVDFEAANSNEGSGSPALCSFTGASVPNRLLLVGMQANGGPTVSSPNYGGAALTLLDRQNDLFMYYLINPAVGTDNISLGLDVSEIWAVGGVLLEGVNQSTPFGTHTKTTNNEQTSIEAAVSSAANGLVVDVCVMINDAMAAAVGQTERVSRDSVGAGFTSFGMSTKPGTGGSVTMHWDASVSFGDNAIIVVPVLAAVEAQVIPVAWLRG